MSRRPTTLLLMAGLLVTSAVVATPAGAAKKQPFCDVVADLENFDNSGTNRSAATRVANQYHGAAKVVSAPKKVVKALDSIGDYYEAIADADNAAEQATTAVQFAGRYSKAVVTYTKHFTKNCLTVTTTTTRAGSSSVTTSTTTSTSTSTSTSTPAGSGSGSNSGTGSGGNATIAGSINGQPAVNPSGTCSGVGSSSGLVRSNDGTFQLIWSNNIYQLQWTAGGTTYLGPVQVIVVGTSLTFNGTTAGVSVQGAAACT